MIPTPRPATPADAPGIARTHLDSWRTTYKGIIADEFLSSLSYDRRQQYWYQLLTNPEPGACFFVAEESDEILGFASAGPERGGQTPCQAEIYAIYLLEKSQRKGIGQALMHTACTHLLSQGNKSLLIWVLKDNLQACKFYQALGGKYCQEKYIEIGSQSLLEIAYVWDDLKTIFKE